MAEKDYMVGEFPESLEERAKLLGDVQVKDISSLYRMQNVLGAGAQATVYQAVNKKSSRKVAIKVLDIKELEDDDLFDALRMEIMILRQLKHPYVCNLIESVRDENHMYIVMELLGGGELFEQLLAKGPFKEDYALAIFAQVAIACDYMHGLDVVHRDLKAENLVFAAKGSPVIKFIDFGGASMWTAEEGLTGLVGTPQYVAPEVVTGFGENNATGEPYGKGCDLWSMGVLLYVMLSKTMPFRAKEVDQLLRQVVKGKFKFTPEDRWKHISPEAKDLISGLLKKDVKERLTIQQVMEHPWAADAIKRTLETMPKMEDMKQASSAGGRGSTKGGALFGPGLLQRMKSAAGKKVKIEGRPKNKGVSREQQYWYAMEISPPTDMKKGAGVKLGADGKFELDGEMPDEMRQMLEEIEKQKAAKAASGGNLGAPPKLPDMVGMASNSSGGVPRPPDAPPPPPGAPPPPPPDVSDASADMAGAEAKMHRLSVEHEAKMRSRGQSEVMDTLLLMSTKDAEIESLKQELHGVQDEVAKLKEELAAARSSSQAAVPPPTPPPPAPPPPASSSGGGGPELEDAIERAEKAEAEALEAKQALVKVQAKLNAVSTLYTEAAQREAVLRLEIEQAQNAAKEALYD